MMTSLIKYFLRNARASAKNNFYPDIVGSLNGNYRYISVAIQILQDNELVPIP